MKIRFYSLELCTIVWGIVEKVKESTERMNEDSIQLEWPDRSALHIRTLVNL